MIAAGLLGRKSGRGFFTLRRQRRCSEPDDGATRSSTRARAARFRRRMRSRRAPRRRATWSSSSAPRGARRSRASRTRTRDRDPLELGTECLGVHTGETAAPKAPTCSASRAIGCGTAAPTKLVELVRQPNTGPRRSPPRSRCSRRRASRWRCATTSRAHRRPADPALPQRGAAAPGRRARHRQRHGHHPEGSAWAIPKGRSRSSSARGSRRTSTSRRRSTRRSATRPTRRRAARASPKNAASAHEPAAHRELPLAASRPLAVS